MVTAPGTRISDSIKYFWSSEEVMNLSLHRAHQELQGQEMISTKRSLNPQNRAAFSEWLAMSSKMMQTGGPIKQP